MQKSCEQLEALMKKLRDGWDGFVKDGYSPIDYGPRNLLSTIYWDLAHVATSERSPNRYELMTILHQTRPLSEDDPWWKDYEHTLKRYGLETLHR